MDAHPSATMLDLCDGPYNAKKDASLSYCSRSLLSSCSVFLVFYCNGLVLIFGNRAASFVWPHHNRERVAITWQPKIPKSQQGFEMDLSQRPIRVYAPRAAPNNPNVQSPKSKKGQAKVLEVRQPASIKEGSCLQTKKTPTPKHPESRR